MAERRMFAKSIVLSDAFLDMPLSARCLYFTFGMLADDDGFVGNPKSIIRQCGATQDDMLILLQKRFLLTFDSGIIVIKHWRINNYLRSDRYTSTNYKEELRTLMLDENNAYTEQNNVGIPSDNQRYTQDSIGKDRLGKDRIEEAALQPQKRKRFIPPTVEEVAQYCKERANGIDAQKFVDYYTANGWVQGRQGKPVKDWKACVRTWEKNNYNSQCNKLNPSNLPDDANDLRHIFGD